jgi:hypothetical protein
MKMRSKLISAGVGAAMVLGSMVAFPSAASAAPGDITISGTITIFVPVPVSLAGPGSTSGSVWTSTGQVAGSGSNFCLHVSSIAFNDTINWGVSPVTQTITNASITIDTTTCAALDRGVCVLDLLDPQGLEAASFTGSPRTGTFASTSDPVGGFTITEPFPNPPITCTAALANLIRLFLDDDSGNSGLGAGNATFDLGASLIKSIA